MKTIDPKQLGAVTGGNMFSRVFAAGAVSAIVGKPIKLPKHR